MDGESERSLREYLKMRLGWEEKDLKTALAVRSLAASGASCTRIGRKVTRAAFRERSDHIYERFVSGGLAPVEAHAVLIAFTDNEDIDEIEQLATQLAMMLILALGKGVVFTIRQGFRLPVLLVRGLLRVVRGRRK